MTKVKLCELVAYPNGNRVFVMQLVCGRSTRRTVRRKPDGTGVKDAPAAVNCHCPRCQKGA